MHPDSCAAGQVPNFATFSLVPPVSWGRTTWFLAGGQVTADNVPLCDRLIIDFTGIELEVPYQKSSLENYAPFNQYASTLWRRFQMPPVTPFVFNQLISSTPPCLFGSAVAAGGKALTLYVLECAGNSLFSPPAFGLLDMLEIYVPWVYLAANPAYPQVRVTTQATFWIWEGAFANPVDPNFFLKSDPVQVAEAWESYAPELGLAQLQFPEFFPGDPTRRILPNTIKDSPLEAITVTLQLGEQLQSRNTITLSAGFGFFPTLDAAFFAVDVLEAVGRIWADPSGLPPPAQRLFPVGPACGTRPGSIHCCSQSVATILSPFVSQLTLPMWWNTLVITLGPPGCVIPANRKFSFVVPKVYLGRNPKAFNFPGRTPVGFNALDVRASTQKEAGFHFVQRISESSIFAYDGSAVFGDEPQGLEQSWQTPDLFTAGGSSSYVAGSSTVASLKVQPDTTGARLQPTAFEVSIVFNAPFAPLPTPATTSSYFILITANQGVFRSNVGALRSPIPLVLAKPAACGGALLALTTAYSTFVIGIRDAACLQALGAARAALSFTIPATFLLQNPSAGTVVTFDIRVVAPMNTVLSLQGPLAVVDDAALMNVHGYTIVADCSVMPNVLGPVGDIAADDYASRCILVNAITQISPVTAGFLQCQPGANVNNAQQMVTFVKIAEGTMNGNHWPGTNLPPPASAWPQNVAIGGSPPIYVTNWGHMWSSPMFAVVVSYPPTWANVKALGVTPTVNSAWQVAFIMRLDRLTVACSTVTEENPWAACIAPPVANLVSVLLFPSHPENKAGVPLETQTHSNWLANQKAVCLLAITDGALVGFYSAVPSPTGDGGSDGAWYAFFAFFALPLLLLLCCLLAALLFLRRKKKPECCPAAPQYPVQEAYWVNTEAPAVAPSPYLRPGTPSYYA